MSTDQQLPDRLVVYEYELPDGRTLHVGDVFKVGGEGYGQFRFISFTYWGLEGWIDCVGGRANRPLAARSFEPERVLRILKPREVRKELQG